ncbi:hypothetical protein G3M48_000663 [Beauveria asiatica]|uniref:Peptidase S1 domain-containing protein n=1 Tax=Beauveria asiatica TaxID=1069075 RepID=A0AAW0RGM2_9HYPO
MVSQSFLSTALAFSAVSVGAVSVTKRLTGGEDAREGEFPSVVRLGGRCADSDSFDSFVNIPVVKAGVVNLGDEGVVSEYIKLSPEQKKLANLPVDKDAYAPNDIAIVKLVTPIPESKTIKHAKLPKPLSDPKVNSTAVASSLDEKGDTNRDARGAQGERDNFQGLVGVEKLSKIVIPVHPRQACVDLGPTAVGSRDTIVCAGGNGKTTCGQDSGGPLFDQETGELIGVTSFGSPDKNEKYCSQAPGVFTRVASYMDFINANLGGAGGLPTADYAWTRRAAATLQSSCWLYGDKAACERFVQPCAAEVKPGTDGAATAQALRNCAKTRMACAWREGPKLDRCIDKVKKCVKKETGSLTPWGTKICYEVDDEDDE